MLATTVDPLIQTDCLIIINKYIYISNNLIKSYIKASRVISIIKFIRVTRFIIGLLDL